MTLAEQTTVLARVAAFVACVVCGFWPALGYQLYCKSSLRRAIATIAVCAMRAFRHVDRGQFRHTPGCDRVYHNASRIRFTLP